MAAISRSADDLIIDNIVEALEDFSAEQVIQSALVGFNVARDLIRPLSRRDLPLVNVWCESLEPQREGSSAKNIASETATINIDCYAKAADEDDDEDSVDDAVAVMARLYYLKEQVKYGLYRLISADMGMTPGTIGKKSWPRWRSFVTDAKIPETVVVAGRWTLEVTYTWVPEDIEGTELERIAVDAELWSGYYDY